MVVSRDTGPEGEVLRRAKVLLQLLLSNDMEVSLQAIEDTKAFLKEQGVKLPEPRENEDVFG